MIEREISETARRRALRDHLLSEVAAELVRAAAVHPPLNSAHEAYSVILEELDEFWEEVRKRRAERDKRAMRQELIQLAAMAVRAIEDLGLGEEVRGER